MRKKKYLCKIYCCGANYFLENMKGAGEKVDMVMTDPSSTYDENFNLEWLKLCYDLLKGGKVLCSFCSPPTLNKFIKQTESIGFKHLETFARFNGRIGKHEPCIIVCKGKCKAKPFIYLEEDYPAENPVRGFPVEAQKPLALIKDLIEHFTKRGDLVVDHFLGSGTTTLACHELKRNFKGCEIEEKFCMVAKKRLGFKDMYATGL